MHQYNRDYYENGINTGLSCYENYRWIPELTIPMAHNMILRLGIDKKEKILDFGCGKGFVVKAFGLLGHDCLGVDISEYAVANAPNGTRGLVRKIYSCDDIRSNYDWVIAKDVLEHISLEELKKTVRSLSERCDKMFVVVPLGKDGEYFAERNNQDVTHVICEDLGWWMNLLSKHFDSVSCSTYMCGIKESYKDIPNAHGFFILKHLKGHTND